LVRLDSNFVIEINCIPPPQYSESAGANVAIASMLWAPMVTVDFIMSKKCMMAGGECVYCVCITGSRRPCFDCRDEHGMIDPDKYPFNSTSGEPRQI